MNEFRQDPVSGDWVIIAPGRAKRPNFLEGKKNARRPAPKSGCPFEHPERDQSWPPIHALPSIKKWRVIALPNKYPALAHQEVCSVPFRHDMYFARTGVGDHDLVITRDHRKNFANLSLPQAVEVFAMFKKRVRDAVANECLNYIVPFFNWGPKAGASVWHPHYQILALPIIPVHSGRSLSGAAAYAKRKHRCVRCDIVKAEKKEKRRVIAENARAIAVAPYAAKLPLEIRIMPKVHYPYFYKTPTVVVRDVVALVQKAMRLLKANANDPDLNFFVHEAPVDGKRHDYHHWHVEILPRLTTPAGFEFSTGIYINTVPPETAAAILRGRKIQ